MTKTVYRPTGRNCYHYKGCDKLTEARDVKEYPEEYAQQFWELCKFCDSAFEFDSKRGVVAND